MSRDSIKKFISKLPGFLRVNVNTLRPKMDFLVLIEMACMAQLLHFKEQGPEATEQEVEKEKVVDKLVVLYESIGKYILEHNGIVLTFSIDRIYDRLARCVPVLIEADCARFSDNGIDSNKIREVSALIMSMTADIKDFSLRAGAFRDSDMDLSCHLGITDDVDKRVKKRKQMRRDSEIESIYHVEGRALIRTTVSTFVDKIGLHVVASLVENFFNHDVDDCECKSGNDFEDSEQSRAVENLPIPPRAISFNEEKFAQWLSNFFSRRDWKIFRSP
jgi:hypothetical protein